MYKNIPFYTSIYIFIVVLRGWGACRTPSSWSLYPYSIAEDIADIPWADKWYVRAQKFGRSKPRLGGLNVAETAVRKKTVLVKHA